MRDVEQLSNDKHKAMRELTRCVFDLNDLASNLENAGFIPLASKIDRIICRMSKATSALDKIDGEEVQAMIEQSHQSSTNMLKACLAGVELGKK